MKRGQDIDSREESEELELETHIKTIVAGGGKSKAAAMISTSRV